MKCTACGYLLWGLSEGRCPECAAAFEATEYAFTPGSVAFVCACGAAYAGTDANGWPQPQRFECPACGDAVDAGGMAVRPIAEGAYGEPLRFGTAWEQRDRVGFVRGFADDLARLTTQPEKFFRL